jgi:hypothetical protein
MSKRIRIRRPKKRPSIAEKYVDMRGQQSAAEKLKDRYLDKAGEKLNVSEDRSPLDEE